jgi:hypothetical protein
MFWSGQRDRYYVDGMEDAEDPRDEFAESLTPEELQAEFYAELAQCAAGAPSPPGRLARFVRRLFR